MTEGITLDTSTDGLARGCLEGGRDVSRGGSRSDTSGTSRVEWIKVSGEIDQSESWVVECSKLV